VSTTSGPGRATRGHRLVQLEPQRLIGLAQRPRLVFSGLACGRELRTLLAQRGGTQLVGDEPLLQLGSHLDRNALERRT